VNLVTAILFAVGMAVLALALLAVMRAVARDQRARHDEPRDRARERARRHELRAENAHVVRTMIFGRWADGSRFRDPPDDDESPPRA
jgi:hypothetical protein